MSSPRVLPVPARLSPADRRVQSHIRDLDILAFIRSHTAEKGYPPTIREIGIAADISSTSVVNYHLDKLVDAGKLSRDRSISRGIKLVDDKPAASTEHLRALVEAARRLVGS